MLGNAWSSPAAMPLSSSHSAEEAALQQLQHLRDALLPYDHSGLELSGMFSPFPPPPGTMAVAPGEEANSLRHCGLLMPPTAAELQAEAAARLGLNLGARTCFWTSTPDGELIPSVCWLSGGDSEASEGGVCGGLTGSDGVLYTSGARCQAEGCCADLAKAKQYHRRHKVCEFHSKAAAVVAHGLTQRFCQQCSRFHVLSEFDHGKRSCRRRLAEHNRRRRKYPAPPPPPSTPASAAAAATPPDPASVEPSDGCDESMAARAAADVAPTSPTWMAMERWLGQQEGSPAANSSWSPSSPTYCASSHRSSSTSAPPHALHHQLYSPWAPMSMWEAEPTREYWN